MNSVDLSNKIEMAVTELNNELSTELLGVARLDVNDSVHLLIVMTDRSDGKRGEIEFNRRQSLLQVMMAPLIESCKFSVYDFHMLWIKFLEDDFNEFSDSSKIKLIVDNGLAKILELASNKREEIIEKKISDENFKVIVGEAIGKNIFVSAQQSMLITAKDEIHKFADKLRHELKDELIGVVMGQPSNDDEGKQDDEQDQDRFPVLIVLSNLSHDEHLGEKIAHRQEILTQLDKDILSQSTYNIVVIHVKMIWDACYTADYNYIESIATGDVYQDQGLLARIRAVNNHKNAVVEKFEKYVIAYVIAGSLVRDQAKDNSDIDVYVIINDTDVRKMTLDELRDKLRAIIIGQANDISNDLNVQTYLLTDYWFSLKDGSPILYTLLRDGVQFYDPTGMFLAWKKLLLAGRLQPSPEAIQRLENIGKEYIDRIEKKLREIVMEDIYYAVLSPSQAILMKTGYHPTDPLETIQCLENRFVNEKTLSKEHLETVELVYQFRKKLEHDSDLKVDVNDLNSLFEKAKNYNKYINELSTDMEINFKLLQIEHARQIVKGILVSMTDDEKIAEENQNLHQEILDLLIANGKIPANLRDKINKIITPPQEVVSTDTGLDEIGILLNHAKETLAILHSI